MGVKECFDGVIVRVADWVFDRIPVDLVELCFQFDDRVGYVGIGRRRPAEEIDRVGDLLHFVVLRFLVLVNSLDRDPDASATPINAPNIVSSMSATFRFFVELLPITASVIYHSSTDFSIQKRCSQASGNPRKRIAGFFDVFSPTAFSSERNCSLIPPSADKRTHCCSRK